ncbi:Ger(x)C family spore germination protein [Paenibacillus cremeus]|uniref:Ger(X)C family spore germination protein n=1 Tax=Paenibacillus cremeus TaxID=2163881 RepID=A0A559K407_9BACL|nr:Ger(x)C family spore germination protein [Paenibacillus cremeus]TVY06873.1 Ger(x)C family spore germination protein [Paenibacillus cremeus]
MAGIKSLLRVLTVLVLAGLTLMTTGCWDRVEIDERGFVIGIAVDLPRNPKAEKRSAKEAPNKPKGKQRYAVTYQYVLPGRLGSSGGGRASSSSSGGEAFLNATSEGDTLYDIDKQETTRISRSPYYEHMKIIIVSDELSKRPGEFSNVLDFFLRTPEMRRSAKVLVSSGEARAALEIHPETEKLTAIYINSITENSKKTGRMLPATKLGDIHEYLLSNRSFAVQRVVGTGGKEAKVVGASIFHSKSNRMIGFLGPEETEGLNLLTGKFHSGMVKAQVDDGLVVFEASTAKRKIIADVSDPHHIRFTIQLQVEGTIGETFKQMDFQKKETLQKTEKAVVQEIERMEKEAIAKLQKRFKTDAIGLGAYLEENYYKVWKPIQSNWDSGDNLFASSEIALQTSVKIRRAGTINRSTRS